jgi:hypothetical protein
MRAQLGWCRDGPGASRAGGCRDTVCGSVLEAMRPAIGHLGSKRQHCYPHRMLESGFPEQECSPETPHHVCSPTTTGHEGVILGCVVDEFLEAMEVP